ncbi:GNAT family N-acetyltransferase [Microlunatus flavus]|uniref:Acetyltransferase (GNAT) family protein n=1 Tax=Microlunatus flavus TaxID=1036181 RepID=A0A1H9I906_9ACTN|nr:GNAT family N-acetyltransferase [Microlunatus flavus]SEQ71026.1 Acetyltransferase (GNAT) family protein [Microlunatus flavus]
MSSTPEARSLVLREDGEPVAEAELGGDLPVLHVERLWVGPGRLDVLGTLAGWVRDHAAGSGATVLELEVPVDDPVRTALADGTRLLGERMTKPLTAEPQIRPGFAWRVMTPEELGPWQERSVAVYAQDGLDGFGGDLELALADAREDFARLLPDGLGTADTSLGVLEADGVPVGHLWVRHHRAPGMSYVYDVEVDEVHRGRGHGRSAMLVAERLAREAGDEVLGLHVFGWNVVARSLYRSLGYTLVSSTHDLLAPA